MTRVARVFSMSSCIHLVSLGYSWANSPNEDEAELPNDFGQVLRTNIRRKQSAEVGVNNG